MKILLSLLMAVLCNSACYKKLHAQPATEVRDLLEKLMIKEHIPGLAYAVIKSGKIETMGTLGEASIPFDQPVTMETVFQLASCSKMYCSLLLGKLFDLELLQPGQTLGTLIDSAPVEWKNITVLQLAAHQSGIKMGDFSKARTSAQAVAVAKKMPLEYEPGSRSAYVSSDYWILQYLVEKATGLTYYKALKKYVLDPLKLEHTFVNNPGTGFITDLDIVPQMAQEYHWFENDSTLRISQMWFNPSGYTAGGIYSSIADMARVAQVFDSSHFMSDSSRELLTHPVLLSDGKPGSFGLGLIVNDNYQGHKLVEHSGGPALADFVRFDQEKISFIVLTNNRGVYPYLAKAIATLYLRDLQYPNIPR